MVWVRRETDVLVAGGGTAGIAAAIAAGRTGVRTLLVDRFSFLGGEAMTGLNLHGFHTNSEEHVVKGIGWEIVERLMAMGMAADMRFSDPCGHDEPLRMARDIAIDREAFSYVVFQMLAEAGVDLLFHSYAADVVREGNSIRGMVVENKSGRTVLPARTVIDCTGDGDIAAMAGAPFEKGRRPDGVMQPLSLMFTVGNVDIEKAVDTIGYRRAEALDPKPGMSRYLHFTLSLDRWSADLQREFGDVPPFTRFTGNALRTGIINGTTATHVAKVDATNAEELTKAEVQGRQVAFRLVAFMRRHVPGFENAFLLSCAPHIGVRETRRILGDYYLTYEDVLEGRRFDDVVALGAFFMDIHDYRGGSLGFKPEKGYFVKDFGSYDIPYRCLLPQQVDGLLLAGRNLSASHEAHSSARVMGTCLAMGHAAGVAAALAVQSGAAVRAVDVHKVQETLLAQGAFLGERFEALRVPAPLPRQRA
ncbi:MAG: FAD-dependent oxidoreductase [Chloroflexota bacterium]